VINFVLPDVDSPARGGSVKTWTQARCAASALGFAVARLQSWDKLGLSTLEATVRFH